MKTNANLLAHQVRYQTKLFRRNPMSAFFTIAFPLIFLVLFGGLIPDVAEGVSAAQFYAPGLAVFAATSATFVGIGVALPIYRDSGILKRVKATPLPKWVYMGGVIGSALVVAAGGTALMLGVGFGLYGLEMEASRIVAAVVSFLVGATAFAALGLALAAVAPSGQSAPAFANGILLPMSFVSNVFISVRDNPPVWLDLLGDVLPMKPFADSFYAAFDPFLTGSAFQWALLAQLGGWTVFGIVVALACFKWEPRVN